MNPICFVIASLVLVELAYLTQSSVNDPAPATYPTETKRGMLASSIILRRSKHEEKRVLGRACCRSQT